MSDNILLALSENDRYNEFFKVDEFTCKCGCGKTDMKYIFINKLTLARNYARIPFNINSGFRCEEYQRELYKNGITQTLDSAHPDGTGVDIETESSWHRFKIRSACQHAGFNRFGHSKEGNFLHVDCYDKAPKDVEWIY